MRRISVSVASVMALLPRCIGSRLTRRASAAFRRLSKCRIDRDGGWLQRERALAARLADALGALQQRDELALLMRAGLGEDSLQVSAAALEGDAGVRGRVLQRPSFRKRGG